MAPTIPTSTPSEIEAGSTVEWTRTFPDFAPGDGFVPTYHVRGAGELNVTGTVGTSDYSFVVTAANSKNLPPGRYTYAVRMVSGAAVHTVERGAIVVAPNIETATAGDLRSENERALERVTAQIKKREEAGIAGYGVAGRNVQYDEIQKLYARQQALTDAIRLERSGGRLPSVAFTFRSPR